MFKPKLFLYLLLLSITSAALAVNSFDPDGFTPRAPLALGQTISVGTRGLFLAVRGDIGTYRLSLESLSDDDRTDDLQDALEIPAEAGVNWMS